MASTVRSLSLPSLGSTFWAWHEVSPSWQKGDVDGSRSLHGSQGRTERPGQDITQGHAPSDLLPVPQPCLLEFLPPPKIASPAEDPGFNTWAHGDSSWQPEYDSSNKILCFIHTIVFDETLTEHLLRHLFLTASNNGVPRSIL